jgi:CBS domain-containing protein
MKVRDAMTADVETVPLNTSLVAAARLMRHANIGFLPVVEDGIVYGVVTDRDLLLRGIAEGRNPHMTTVGNLMTRALVWCYEDEVLTEAARVMEENHIRRLLVLDNNKRLVGLLSLDDLALKMSSDRLLGSVVRHVTAA